MGTDGSDLGVTAERALSTILGGDPLPDEDEQQTPEQVTERIKMATPDSYAGATDCMTRAVLRLFEQREETRVWPSERVTPESVYDPDTNTFSNLAPDLYAAAKEAATADEVEAFEGCTGFMWGFAVNQARWLTGQHPGSNPAVVTINVPDGD